MKLASPSDETLNFYKVVRLGKCGRGDAFACAVRQHGILGVTLSENIDLGSGDAHTFPGLDVVSVCSLASPDWPLAAAGLGLDRTILLSRNVLEAQRPQTLRFDNLEGTAYTILSTNGHLFILTSTSLAIVLDVASSFLKGEALDGPTTIRQWPIRAVDIYLAYDRWLLLVLEDRVISVSIDRLVPRGDLGSNGPAQHGAMASQSRGEASGCVSSTGNAVRDDDPWETSPPSPFAVTDVSSF
jgi:hypothetical protein